MVARRNRRTRLTEPPAPPLKPEEIERITDPAERAVAANALIDFAEWRRQEGLRIRNEAWRQMYASGAIPSEIAALTDSNPSTVRGVCQ